MRVRWISRALDDVERVRAYIARDDRRAASRVHRRIMAAVRVLGRFPASGRVGEQGGTRVLVVPRTPYLVVYRVTGAEVEILRVLHGAQDWPR